jgi:uncharacterized membrane protein
MKLPVARWVALVAYLALLALTLVWHAWLAPSVYFPVSLVVLVMAGPLLLPLRGLLHGRPRSHLWAAFLSLLYFTHGVGEAVANPSQRWPALAETVLSLALFFAATLYVRWASAAHGDDAG